MSAFLQSQRLPHPVRITEQVWPEETVPVVTIRCITYNHVNFIRDAIEGFLMQETTFPVEIIIHDDASTDGTAEIVKDYADKHPQLFRPILQKENQYSQGREIWARVRCRIDEMQRGEFIATCEGDDYWISKYKLQKQVEFFDIHPNAILCGCRTYVKQEPYSSPYTIVPNCSSSELRNLTPFDLIRCNWYLKTLTRMTKSSFIKEFNSRDFVPKFADYAFVIACAISSINTCLSVGCIDEIMCVYREHDGGVWSGVDQVKHLEADLEVLGFALNYSKQKDAKKASEIIISLLYRTLRELSWKKNTSNLQKIRYGMEALSYNRTFFAKMDFLRFVSIIIYQQFMQFIKK